PPLARDARLARGSSFPAGRLHNGNPPAKGATSPGSTAALAADDSGPEAFKAKALSELGKALDRVKVSQTNNQARLALRTEFDRDELSKAVVKGILKSLEEANSIRSQQNLLAIYSAMRDYQSAKGTLPPAVVFSKDGRPLYSWRVELLPFLKEKNLY